MLPKKRHHSPWIWGSRPSTHWMKAVSVVNLLPGFKGENIDSIRWQQIKVLVKRHWLEFVWQSQTITIAIKLIWKFWGGNQEFDCQNISISWPPLELTPIGKNTTNLTSSKFELTYIEGETCIPHTTDTTNGMARDLDNIRTKRTTC